MKSTTKYHLTGKTDSGPVHLHCTGRFTCPGWRRGGAWTKEDAGVMLLWDDDVQEFLKRASDGCFESDSRRLIECESRIIGAWHDLDPSLTIYKPLRRKNLLITTTWSGAQRGPGCVDLVLSGENARIKVLDGRFHFSHLRKSGIANFFAGVPKLDHPHAFHLPHFYDYWSRLGNLRPARVKPVLGISFVSSNAGKFGALSIRRIAIAKELSKWFPVAVSSGLRNQFEDCPGVSFHDVPFTRMAKYDFLSRYRYNLCFENSTADGYLTEKPFDSLVSGAVPLYAGDPLVSAWFAPGSLIDCAGLMASEIADRIMDTEHSSIPDLIWERREALISPGLEEMSEKLENFLNMIEQESRSSVRIRGSSKTASPSEQLITDGNSALGGEYADVLERTDTRILGKMTVVIKTFMRPEIMWQTLQSFIRRLGPEIPIIVVDDSPESSQYVFPEQVVYLRLPYDSGLSAGRNRGVACVKTPYVFIADDDFQLMSSAEAVAACLHKLESGWDIVGASAMIFEKRSGTLDIQEIQIDKLFTSCDATDNFFVTRADFLRNFTWDENIKIGYEHADFFLRTQARSARILGTAMLQFRSFRWKYPAYSAMRRRNQVEYFINKWGFKDSWHRAEFHNVERLRHPWTAKSGVCRNVSLISGGWLLPGWLNLALTDRPEGAGLVEKIDSSEELPLRSNESELVYWGGGVERLSYLDGVRMLKECWRILRPGGTLRLCSFDLDHLRRLLVRDDGEDLRQYVKWVIDNRLPLAPGYDPVFVVNHLLQDRGYTYLYDESILAFVLEELGFCNIQKFRPGESTIPDLCLLEDDLAMPDGFFAMESLILECSKVANPDS